MEELIIHKYQAKAIQNALRLTIRIYKCRNEETAYDREVMRSYRFINEILEDEG